MKCPKCGEELDCDEVDIGVGTLKGNCRCPNPNCGYSDQDGKEESNERREVGIDKGKVMD